MSEGFDRYPWLKTSSAEMSKKAALSDADIDSIADKHLRYQEESRAVSGIYDFAEAIEAKVLEATVRRLTAEQSPSEAWVQELLRINEQKKTAEQGGAEPTDAMIEAYLKANDAYWVATDNAPARDPSRWRNGTVKEATRVSLRAALATQPQAEPADARIYWHASQGWQGEWLTPAPNGGQSNYYRHTEVKTCRGDGRCQYAIDHGAEGLGHCPKGKCAMPFATPTAPTEPT